MFFGSLKNDVAGKPRKISCGRPFICLTVLGTHLGEFPASYLSGEGGLVLTWPSSLLTITITLTWHVHL
jgi:hypothetical protein